MIALWNWLLALGVVASPFIKIFMIWLGWQLGLGAMAWGTARFYSENCAAPGISGFLSSLFTMGSPVCISAWVGVAAFSIAYITAFIAAVMLVVVWLWNRTMRDSVVRKLMGEISQLKKQMAPDARLHTVNHTDNT